MTEEGAFIVDNMGKADFCLSKIAEAQKEIDKNNYYADEQMNKIKRFKEDANKEHVNTVEFMEAHLQQYLMNEGKKSQKLINGNIGLRKRMPKFVIQDDDELVQFLEDSELHNLVRVKKTPALSQLRKHLTVAGDSLIYPITGEKIEGVRVEEQEPSFNFKLK